MQSTYFECLMINDRSSLLVNNHLIGQFALVYTNQFYVFFQFLHFLISYQKSRYHLDLLLSSVLSFYFSLISIFCVLLPLTSNLLHAVQLNFCKSDSRWEQVDLFICQNHLEVFLQMLIFITLLQNACKVKHCDTRLSTISYLKNNF